VPKAGKQRFIADLGLRIVELRQRRGLTQEQLAEAIGCSTRYLQLAESGRANLTLTSLGELSIALRCSVADLFAPTEKDVRRRPGRPRQVAKVTRRSAKR
jgi:transcriptional regulator with XRE-family HTH domain